MHRHHTNTSRLATAVSALALVAVALGACGGSSHAAGDSSSAAKRSVGTALAKAGGASSHASRSSTEGTPSGRGGSDAPQTRGYDAYTACLRANGASRFSFGRSGRHGGSSGTLGDDLAGRRCEAQIKDAIAQLEHQAAKAAARARVRGAAPASVPARAPTKTTQPARNRVRPALKLALDRFSACMRAHGVDLPPPVTTGGSLFDTNGLNKSSPTFKAALLSCNSILQGATNASGQP
jgi:hypothetical protein